MMGIVVPYRDRKAHLDQFLPHMAHFLKSLPHKIYIIEQTQKRPFNRGKLLNIGFVLAKADVDYICLHDVDMLPITADYSAPSTPLHLATKVEQFGFDMPYPTYFGGVTLFPNKDFILVNGYSNEYWGWGTEDDDLRTRCLNAGLSIESRPGYFSSLEHERVPENDPLVMANQDRLEEFIYGPSIIPEEGLKTLQFSLLKRWEEGGVYFCLVEI